MTTITYELPIGFTFDDSLGTVWEVREAGISIEVELLATTRLRLSQYDAGTMRLEWELDVPEPVRVTRVTPDPIQVGDYSESTTELLDYIGVPEASRPVAYFVTGLTSGAIAYVEGRQTATDAPATFGPVPASSSPCSEPRYTTLEAVKNRMGISHSERDELITEAICAAEQAIDQINGRSFPDAGTNPEYTYVPEAIRTWALDASIAIWKAADAPHGQGGSEAWLGTLDVVGETERILRRHPLALGYKISWGVA